MNHIIQESILEYKLTYSGERLFGASIPRAFIKSIKESVKCFIDLIKPHDYEDIFQLEVFNHEIQKTIKISNRANHSLGTWHKSISRFDRYIANYTIASIRQRERIHHQHLLTSKDGGVYATDVLRRHHSLRKRIKAIIQTAIATVILCGIWQMLEYLIYGEVQPRIVDDIMVLFFIPFIYISARD